MMFVSYLLIRVLTGIIALLPYSMIHCLGRAFGTVVYYTFPKYRKRSLSNLALAKSLNLSNKQIRMYAKMSMQNLMITCLEYAKLGKEKDISRIAHCENPETAAKLMKERKNIIFFCGHQSNWEVLFLEGTSRMPGVAIGRPIKNHYLYKWIVSVREHCGGKIISPKNAIKEGLKALKAGSFLGIVGDQGMPDSGFSSLFLGRKAWTSPLPAILSHRTGLPIMVAMTRREKDHYVTTYSDPIWPDQEAPAEKEIPRLMNITLEIFEESIEKRPGEWLWSHNRFKQQLPGRLKKAFRHDSIAILCPADEVSFNKVYNTLQTFEKIYPGEFLHIYVHSDYKDYVISDRFEVYYYDHLKDLFLEDYRFKLVFNFTGCEVFKKHFLSLSAFEVFSWKDLQKIAKTTDHASLSETLEKAAYAR